MGISGDSLIDLLRHRYDDVIDVRSPSEFAEDHLPGAINLPVLNDPERAEVGTIYKQDSRFNARKLGAALVLRNVARHVETALVDRPADWRPLVYCWRGGQRSGTFACLMREIGWRAETLEGGYRTYRRHVAAMFHADPMPWRFVVLQGMTCTGKTDLLKELAKLGAQTLDLEAAAAHRGSVFGATAAAQPSQKMFESRLAEVLVHYDTRRPVVLEAESSKVGDVLIPPQLWQAMCAAPRVEVSAPLPVRAEYFQRAYADLVADPARFAAKLQTLAPIQGHARVAAWLELLSSGDHAALSASLMETHYDPRYSRALARHGSQPIGALHLESLSSEGITQAAPQVLSLIDRIDGAGPVQVASAS
ncbi:MAG: tRNA 2-selenouridine(34) synthase MnmH [Pseudomonadota bacterium]